MTLPFPFRLLFRLPCRLPFRLPLSALFFAWMGALGVAGCATSSSNSSSVASGRSQTLFNNRSGLAALRVGQLDTAKSHFEQSVVALGGITAGDSSAKRSRSFFHSEDFKTFRGEPYERVMAYYYRGIFYWMDGQPDNARACFRSAMLQDSDAAEGYQSDYTLLHYLDGLITEKLNGNGSAELAQAKSVAIINIPPPSIPRANVFIFLEMGTGPTKYAGGQYGELLQYRPGNSTAVAAQIEVAGQKIQAGAYDNLTFQASTRGGRLMDSVLANKAGFKAGTDSFGNVALLSGAVLASERGRHGSTDEAGAGLLIAGLLSKLVSSATTPQADSRTWDNLPNLLSFASLQLSAGHHQATVSFLDTRSAPTSTATLNFDVVNGRDTILFVSDHR